MTPGPGRARHGPGSSRPPAYSPGCRSVGAAAPRARRRSHRRSGWTRRRSGAGTRRWPLRSSRAGPGPSATNSRRSPALRSSRRKPSTSQRRRPPSTIASTMARSRRVRSASTSAGASTRGHRGMARSQRRWRLASLVMGWAPAYEALGRSRCDGLSAPGSAGFGGSAACVGSSTPGCPGLGGCAARINRALTTARPMISTPVIASADGTPSDSCR